MITWPSTLPLPAPEHSGNPLNATVASGLDSGTIQRRTRFRAAQIRLAVQWNLSLAELGALEAFLLDDLDNGTARFQVELRHPKLTELTTWVARFLGEIASTAQDGRWQVQAQLELSVTVPALLLAPEVGWAPFYVHSLSESDPEFTPFAEPDHVHYFAVTS